jgi:hypothetical protein
MTRPYDLHVEFEKTAEDGALAGVVTIVVCEDCTCRKLLLWPGRSADGGDFLPQGPAQTLADWIEWRAGETYHYPFSASAEPDGSGVWGVRTQVHRVGEWEPDPEQVLLAAPVAQLVLAQPDLAAAPRLPALAAGGPELLGWHGSATPSLVEDVSLEFDREARAFHFGDEISGAVTFTPARDLVDYRVGLDYQWRIHGQTERRSGEHHPVAISAQSTWQAGEAYRLPFRFSIPDGPRTSHGHSEKLDWYVWPVLIPLDGSETLELLQAEAEIELTGRPETDYVLKVDNLSPAAHDHLRSALITLLLALLGPVAVALLANLLSLGLALSHERTVVSSLGTAGAFLILIVGLVVGLRELINQGLAEYHLGIVGVHIAGAGEVKPTVSLQPRRDVRLQGIKLALKVYEVTVVREGTGQTTKRRAIFSRTGKLRLEQRVAARDNWSRTFALPFPPNLPATRGVPGSTSTAIVWRAKLTILQHHRPPWRQSYTLNVNYARVETSHFSYYEAKEMYQLEPLTL